MTLLGWGLDPYGTTIDRVGASTGGSPFGTTPSGEGVSLVSASAITTHEVKVVLSAEPLNGTPTVVGDALNPATWTIQRLDTLEFLNIVQVNKYFPEVYGLVTYQPFGPVTATHEVSTASLLDAGGGICLAPRKEQFAGLLADTDDSPQSKLVKRKASFQDLANPQTPLANPDAFGGTLLIDSSGDYVSVSGEDLVKKLIIRRLLTAPGEFFHLPDYGIGFKLKEPMPTGDLVKLKAEIEAQVKREPEVEDVSATLVLDTAGMILISLRVKLRQSGESLEIGLQTPSFGVTL